MTPGANDQRRPAARASMREVADRAGVAMSSVSRVLSGHPDVSAPMREKVMAVVAELGYQPDRDAAHMRLFEQRRVDGLMLSLASEDNPETLQVLQQFETPAVLVDRELSTDVGASAVLSDHRSGMRDAVDHLLDLGHRRIGLIVGQPMRPSRERRRGLEEAFAARDLPATYTIVEGMLSAEHGRNATRQLLDQPTPPTAIVAGGNQLLIGTLGELLARGLRVGADVSVISCDAIDVTELFDPPIAVVRRDNREIGVQAATLLLERLGEEDPGARTVVLPTAFHPRPSCAPPPGA
jgi:LacI family transcriptional regulator